MNTCARCEMSFNTWNEYNTHVVTQTCFKKIVPLNTSGRTKVQIVDAWEYRHHKHLIY